METTLRRSKFQFLPLFINLVITLAVGFVASIYTRPEIPTWYRTLHKPGFTPPNWAFPVAWTLLYILMAVAAYLVWRQRDDDDDYRPARAAYIIQLFLNFWWSIIFFGMHQILAALVIIVLLWLAITATMYFFHRLSKTACWLLLPYLLWVSFAMALNTAIYLLNR